MIKIDPLHQFEIFTIIPIKIFGIDFSITNSVLFMFFTVFLICFFLFLGTLKSSVIPGKMQTTCEYVYSFVSKIINENVGPNNLKYLPLFISIFLFILFANLVGILPYAFTVTSHISVTFFLALVVFSFMTFSGIFLHGFTFCRIFFPSGVTPLIAPLMIPIEVISYSVKPVSLSVRLFANMMAGHIIMKIIASAAVFSVASGFFFLSPIPILINSVLICFEIFVAILQAYVFTVLSCIYLGNVLNLH